MSIFLEFFAWLGAIFAIVAGVLTVALAVFLAWAVVQEFLWRPAARHLARRLEEEDSRRQVEALLKQEREWPPKENPHIPQDYRERLEG